MRYNISLNKWNFSINELNYSAKVTAPHTWNVDDNVMKHRGIAEYETTVFVDESLNNKKAFISFNAVYHTAKVYINNIFAGEHSRSGFTPFQFDITDKIIFGADNKIKVIADNTYISEMLPYIDKFDWADDGGIIRKAELQFAEQNAVAYLRAEEKIALSDIAKSANMCNNSCISVFKSFTNATPIEYLTNFRIGKASQLLKSTDKSISEIAQDCGFSGSSYFSETFKRIVGKTPREFRH